MACYTYISFLSCLVHESNTKLTLIEWDNVESCLGFGGVKLDGVLLQPQDMGEGELVEVLESCKLVLREVLPAAHLLHSHHHLPRPSEHWETAHLKP